MKRQFYLKRSNLIQRLYEIGYRGDSYGISSQSINFLPARLMALTYPQYLQTCVEDFDASIVINNSIPIPLFKKTKTLELFIKVLNARLGYIVFEKEHPYDIIENEEGELIQVPFTS